MSFTAKLKATVCFILFITAIQAQVPIGTWKTFMPYGSSLMVCDAGDKVYSAAEKSIFSYDKATGLIEFFDKTNILSDVNIKTINYDAGSNCLAVAYTNANIDLIFNETEVYNIRDILNENTSTSIGINSLSFNNGNCYVSTDIGISVINLARKEISNTYIIGANGGAVRVFATAVSGSNIYAATYDGIKYAPVNSTNLQNFNAWALFTEADSIPAKYATQVEAINNRVYATIRGGANTANVDSVADTLYMYNGSKWEKVYYNTKENFTSLKTVNGTLYFTIWNDNNGNTGKQGTIDANGTFSIQNTVGHVRPLAWFISNGSYWEADFWNGFFKNTNGYVENLNPNGPGSAGVYEMTVKDNMLYVAAGGVDDSWNYVYNPNGFYTYDGAAWRNVNMFNTSQMTGVIDVVAVAVGKSKTYFGSIYSGLIEYDDVGKNVTALYTKANSTLDGAIGDTFRTKISSLSSDAFGNVWIGNAGAPNLLKVIKPDGNWLEFNIPYTISLLKRLVIDRNNQIWAPTRQTNGLVVYTYNNTLDNAADDAARLLRTGAGAGNLPDENVYCVAEDKEGNIWVGTNKGIATFYCPGSVFSQYGCDADLITVERDGYLGYLFASESVRAIAVDAANRKWIGTTNGLWLISADGKTEILKFTAENSPLPSNIITDIAINDNTGEVFIGTAMGLISYQGDALGTCTDCDEAIAYPNPVRNDYTGPIAIKGLVEGAYVKITDASGTLVYQGKANGSQMVWDGKGYKGERAKSGVYLVFSSTELGKEKMVTKILLMN